MLAETSQSVHYTRCRTVRSLTCVGMRWGAELSDSQISDSEFQTEGALTLKAFAGNAITPCEEVTHATSY